MGGRVYFHPQGAPDNGAKRYILNNGQRPYITVNNVAGRPGDAIGFNAFYVVGGVYDEWWWSGNQVGIRNWNETSMRGGNPGTANNMPAYGYFGNGSLGSTWTGGMGGYLDWFYAAPGAPNAPSVSRSANGTSLTATTGGGSNRITYYNVSIGSGWNPNGTNFSVDAHTTYSVYSLAGNEDTSTQGGTSTSYGIPRAVQNLSIVRSTDTAGRIITSWQAPTYAGASVNRYVMTRRDTVTNTTTTIVNSNITSFNDNSLVRGRLYDYTIYCVGNSSPGNGISSSINGVMAPGVPSAPGIPTIKSKVGRNLTINSTRGADGFGNAVSTYRVQLSTDGGVTWKGWNNTTKTFTANGTYNTLDSNGDFSYELLEPAQTYNFRVYAVNSIGDGDFATTATGTFVSSGGKRYTGTVWEPTQTAKRWDGTAWVDITVAKRWDGSAWVDLS